VEAKLKPTQRFDALDEEAFAEMLKSRSFAIYRDRLEKTLEVQRGQCERCDDDLGLRRAQGQVAALRVVQGLPEQILAEMRSRPRPRE
jgi:hypothetical protein